MNAREWRRLNEAAGVLMTTRGMDPTRAIIEAAKQLGLLNGRLVSSVPATKPEVERVRP